MTGFAQDDEGVNVELSGGGALRARYLVGCDGGRSSIRKQAGIDFPGSEPSTSYLIAEAEMASEPAWGIRYAGRGIHGLGKLGDEKRVRLVTTEGELRQGGEPTLDDLRAAGLGEPATAKGRQSQMGLCRRHEHEQHVVQLVVDHVGEQLRHPQAAVRAQQR